MASTLGVDMVMTGHSLGRNKLEHLLASGARPPRPARHAAPCSSLRVRPAGSRVGPAGLKLSGTFCADQALSPSPGWP